MNAIIGFTRLVMRRRRTCCRRSSTAIRKILASATLLRCSTTCSTHEDRGGQDAVLIERPDVVALIGEVRDDPAADREEREHARGRVRADLARCARPGPAAPEPVQSADNAKFTK
jgi:hypothetical protein